jgi:hypothetical protein
MFYENTLQDYRRAYLHPGDLAVIKVIPTLHSTIISSWALECVNLIFPPIMRLRLMPRARTKHYLLDMVNPKDLKLMWGDHRGANMRVGNLVMITLWKVRSEVNKI